MAFECMDDCIHLKACRRIQKIGKKHRLMVPRYCTEDCSAYQSGNKGEYCTVDEAWRIAVNQYDGRNDPYDVYARCDFSIKHLVGNIRTGGQMMYDELISRQAAIDYLLDALYDLDEADFVDKEFIEEELKRVPSIQPKQKTGQWINNAGFDKCSKCGISFPDLAPDYDKTNYCPNCGVRMEKQKDE